MKRFLCTGLLCLLSAYSNADDAALASSLISKTACTNGICLLPKLPASGNLTVELAKQSGWVVYGQNESQAVVDAVRSAAANEKMLNTRIFAERGAATNLFLKNDYADAVIMPELTSGELTQPLLNEIVRILCPNGRAILGGSSVSFSQLTNWLSAGGVSGYSISVDGQGTWAVFDKTRPAGEGDWSHWYCNPDNNPVTDEAALKYPYVSRFQMPPWAAAQPQMTVAANGRVFRTSGSAGSSNPEDKQDAPNYFCSVTAHNGYNGRELWQRKWSMQMTTQKSGYIAEGDRFYMMDTNKVLMLDAANGQELAGLEFSGAYPFPKWMALEGDRLYVLLGSAEGPTNALGADKYIYEPWPSSEAPWDKGRLLVCYDVSNWSNLWSYLEPSIIDARNVALHGDYLYFNAPSTNWNNPSISTGLVPRVACLNRNTGALVWEQTNSATIALINQFSGDFGHVLRRPRMGMLASSNLLLVTRQGGANVVAFNATNGAYRWHLPVNGAGGNVHFFLHNNELYEEGMTVSGLGNPAVLEPLTGVKKRAFDSDSTGCARYTVTTNGIYCAGGLGYDLVRNMRIEGAVGFKADCNDSTIPANGALYAAPQICKCNVSLRGFVALEAAPENFNFSPAAGSDRLETTTNTAAGFPAVTTNDWPTYRGNNRRSASTPVEVSGSASPFWTYRASATNLPTQLVSAGGFFFFGGGDGVVRCLKASTGKEVWSYATGSRIIAAPSIADGRVYAGSGDGYVYCLSAADGKLLWRYRLAPYERRINNYGPIASTWPVDSGVLIESGKVYAAAGIIDFDGTHVFCLNATNGALIWQNSTSMFVNADTHKGISAQGFLASAKGKLWMPGGSVCSPNSYDLQTGVCSNGAYGFKRNLRGKQIGVMADDLLVFGSYMLYGRPNEWWGVGGIDIGFLALGASGQHLYNEVSADANAAYLMPAWRDDIALACVQVTDELSCWNRTQMVARVIAARTSTAVNGADGRKAVFLDEASNPAKLYYTNNIPMYGIALASDAGILLQANVAAYATLPSTFWIRAINPTNNATVWSNALPSTPVVDGVSVSKEGIVAVPLADGTIKAFADPAEVPMIVTSSGTLPVPENGSANLGVWLSKAPAQAITVTVVKTSGDTNLTVQSSASLVFTPANWSSTQTVTVAASSDADGAAGDAMLALDSETLPLLEVRAVEQDAHRWNFDFSTALTTDTGWNNVSTRTVGLKITDAVNAVGQVSPVDFRIVTAFASTFTAKGAANPLYPDNATSDGFRTYNNTAGNVVEALFRLEGLDTNLVYGMTVYGSYGTSGSLPTEYIAGGVTNTVNVVNNSTPVYFSGLQATSSNTLELICRSYPATSLHINFLSLEVQTPETPAGDDHDGDGIPNDWEQQYFGGDTNANPAAVCSNGINTVLEAYIAGISPVDPSARLELGTLQPLTDRSVLQWSGVTGRVYDVYWTTNLLNGFSILQSNVPATQCVFTDTVHGTEIHGFYRIKVRLDQ